MTNFNRETIALREAMNRTGVIPFVTKPTDPRFRDLTGLVHKHLTVLGFAGKKRWFCKCSCGTLTIVFARRLTMEPYTNSCGHLLHESHNVIHGESSSARSTEYDIYCGAKQRCTNVNAPAYPRYGGRGIEFRFNSFAEFLAEVGRRPSDKHSIDRINNNGHYEKGNLRWATWTEQANNRRKRNNHYENHINQLQTS